MLKGLGIDDQIHYWFISGDQTATIEWETVLAEKLDEEALKQAVLTAMRIHTNFRSHPVIVDGRVKVSTDDDVKQAPVFAESSMPRQLGTAETNGYLFYVSFSGRKLFLRLFHGLADGRASFAFLSTVLGAYVKEKEDMPVDLPEPDSLDTVPVTEKILKEYAGSAPVGRFDSNEHADQLFRLPVDQFVIGERKWRVFEIDVPLAPLLSVSRRSESSVVPVLEAIAGYALRKNYDVGDKIINAYTPVDMRSVFGLKSGGNGSTSVAVPYRGKIDKYDLKDRFMIMRSVLDVQIQPENIYSGVLRMAGLFAKVDSQPYPIETIVSALRQQGRIGWGTPYTYGLSYPGKICFPKQVEPFVDSIVVSVSGGSFPLMIEACEYKGIIRMICTQLFESDEVAKIIYEEIKSIIPGTFFVDRGIKTYDRMDLEKIEHSGQG